MVSGRPLLYLSLPGVAFILGVFWFRRRNKNRIENGGGGGGGAEAAVEKEATAAAAAKLINETSVEEEPIQKINANGIQQSKAKPTPSKSMNIRGGGSSSADDDNNPATKLFGKSAPITIVQNGNAQQTQIDSEVLKNKIQDAGDKVLRSIDEDFENLSSPVDLPDSVNHRHAFYARTVNSKKDAPVVIKATTTPKISPENSFLESKYVNGCEQNNNCADPAKELLKEAIPVTTNTTTTDKSKKQTTIVDTNGNASATAPNTNAVAEKRNVDAASPSLSLCSEQSGDSGKGSSLPRSEATRAKTTYEFFFPNSLVGQLYGRKRTFVTRIQEKTGANVSILKNRFVGKVRICAIEGTESEINAALLMIRQRLPAKRYPHFTMQRIHFALPQTVVPLSTESRLNLQLNLIEGINNDVVVSAVISGGHIFIQHPLHPSHPSLAVLQKCLYDSYTNAEAPLLPGIEISAVCVLPVNGIWYRVQIVEKDVEDEQRCIVKFLDFGGYMNVHLNELRQIRSDFMGVPFQATECILSNIEPIGDSCWSPEAADILCKLTKGIVLQAQVAGYNSHNIPEIYLFACLGPNNVIFINKELVARNLAQWVEEVQD